jgi:hypothetical protein
MDRAHQRDNLLDLTATAVPIAGHLLSKAAILAALREPAAAMNTA